MRIISTLRDLYLTTQPQPWPIEKPVVIQFPVNDVCNSKCQMCNIWQQQFDYQITSSELEKALSSGLYSEVKSIGINGGEPTLRKDLSELVDVLFRKLPKLKAISLITNALNSSQVIQRIIEIGQVIHSHDGRLDVMVSLDGVGEVHDRVRGRPGNFENAVKVVDFIKSSDLVSHARLGCTVIKENIYGVEDLFEFALNKDIYIKYRLGIPHQRLYSEHVVEPFDISFEEKYHFAMFLEHLIKFYEPSERQKHFYKSLIGQLVYQKNRTAGCTWQHRGATLTARGELLYCAVASKTLGSAINQNSEKLYFDNREHLSEIVKTKCDTCTHDYVGLPPSHILLKDYAKKILKKISPFPQEIKYSLRALEPINSIRERLRLNSKLARYGLNFKKIKHSENYPTPKFSSTSNQKCRVLICGWYGTETLGDKAILGGIVNALGNFIGKTELHLASLEPYISKMTLQQVPELNECQLHSISNAPTIAKSMDLVVFGGGPLMALAPIADIIAIFQEALLAKVPTLIAGCGIGPLGAPCYSEAIKYLLSKSSYRIYRDDKSKQMAQMLGIETKSDLVAEDPAFTWLESHMPYNNSPQMPKESLHSKTLILGLRDWPYRQYAKKLNTRVAEQLKNQFELEVVSALMELATKYPDLKIIPFPMCTNHIGGDDRWFYRRLLRNNPELQNAIDVTYLGQEIEPLEALKLFQSASAALTMRYHSLVFALATGVPCVSLDYTQGRGKVKALAERHGIKSLSIDSVNSQFIVDSITEILNAPSNAKSFSSSFQGLAFTKAMGQVVESLNFEKDTKQI